MVFIPTTSPPATDAEACENYATADSNSAGFVLVYTFDDLIGSAIVHPTADPSVVPGTIGQNTRDGVECVACGDFVAGEGNQACTATVGGDPHDVAISYDAGSFPVGRQFKFWLTVTKEGQPGCPSTFGPFCFGTSNCYDCTGFEGSGSTGPRFDVIHEGVDYTRSGALVCNYSGGVEPPDYALYQDNDGPSVTPTDQARVCFSAGQTAPGGVSGAGFVGLSSAGDFVRLFGICTATIVGAAAVPVVPSANYLLTFRDTVLGGATQIDTGIPVDGASHDWEIRSGSGVGLAAGEIGWRVDGGAETIVGGQNLPTGPVIPTIGLVSGVAGFDYDLTITRICPTNLVT